MVGLPSACMALVMGTGRQAATEETSETCGHWKRFSVQFRGMSNAGTEIEVRQVIKADGADVTLTRSRPQGENQVINASRRLVRSSGGQVRTTASTKRGNRRRAERSL